MALEKEIEYKGFTPKYWKITSFTSDAITNKTNVSIGLYKDKATRDGNVNDTIMTCNYSIEGLDFSREDIYKKIKEFEYPNLKRENILKDAKDC
jgi:hypothetical protein